MKTLTALLTAVALALGASGALAGPQERLDGHEVEARQTLAAAGYQYDDSASLLRALLDENQTIAVMATMFLSRGAATPEVIAALRAVSDSPGETLALAAFLGLQSLRTTGWEDAAIALVQRSKDPIVPIELAGILARVGRTEGWSVIQDALHADRPGMGLAVRNAAPFHGLRTPEGTLIDVVAELAPLRRELQRRGRAFDVSGLDGSLQEAESRARARAPAR